MQLARELGMTEGITIALNTSAIRDALRVQGVSASELVVLDYSTLNITEEELLMLHFRYPCAHFLLFSEQLSRDLLRRLLLGNKQFSVVLKDSSIAEVRQALQYALRNQQYICTDAQALISMPEHSAPDRSPLSRTERDILRLMALGKNSKAIAAERFLSVYTVMTHRKNIFRKLQVNNAQEAIRYALRAGIVDPLEYYI
ncbi:MAG: response regulator transcription factor [Bacteroidaceae bacterium]|nr:response regulator transcription factor [Bacteroidaceae bacterium]